MSTNFTELALCAVMSKLPIVQPNQPLMGGGWFFSDAFDNLWLSTWGIIVRDAN